jgi:hypothetical protein
MEGNNRAPWQHGQRATVVNTSKLVFLSDPPLGMVTSQLLARVIMRGKARFCLAYIVLIKRGNRDM